MNLVAIIQARMGSSRLPGKTLVDLAGHSMLAQVVRRVRRCRTLDRVVVATSTAQADHAIEQECQRLGVACFRGSESDVLDRYAAAARHFQAAAVVRITADCPLIDPEVTDRVVRRFVEFVEPGQGRSDCSRHLTANQFGVLAYASNTLRRTYPRGLDTEVFSAAALEVARREAGEPFQRAHVTPYIYQHPEQFRLLAVTGDGDHSQHRWTVDTAEDLELVRAIYARFEGRPTFSWRDVLCMLTETPELAMLNRNVCQKSLVEG